MGRGKELSKAEVRVIQELHAAGVASTEIAKRVKRSEANVSRVASGKRSEKAKARAGRPKKVIERWSRQIVRSVTIGNGSTGDAKSRNKPEFSTRSVQCLLHDHLDMKWKKMKHSTQVNSRHERARLQWAMDKAAWASDEWSKVVFSGEKKWNLDGPDGLNSYWHNSKHPEKVVVKRHSGGGLVMIWGAFFAAGQTRLKFVDGNQDAPRYIETLRTHLLPFIAEKHDDSHIFQQDNAPSHRVHVTKQRPRTNNMSVMEWSAMSPDLNPIEHLWGIMTGTVYANGRQFSSKKALECAVLKAWEEIDKQVLRSLLNSMPNRCAEVTKRRGAFITDL